MVRKKCRDVYEFERSLMIPRGHEKYRFKQTKEVVQVNQGRTISKSKECNNR